MLSFSLNDFTIPVSRRRFTVREAQRHYVHSHLLTMVAPQSWVLQPRAGTRQAHVAQGVAAVNDRLSAGAVETGRRARPCVGLLSNLKTQSREPGLGKVPSSLHEIWEASPPRRGRGDPSVICTREPQLSPQSPANVTPSACVVCVVKENT